MINSAKRTVIFVGGTGYSGSTFFDMMLANDPHGFSCGEVRVLFRPWRPHHVNPACGCGDSECDIWDELKTEGENHLYERLFELLPDVQFIVDSSKHLAWIKKHTRILKAAGVDVKHILIWKTPAEIARSFQKRGQGRRWVPTWCNYHRLYFRLIDDFRAVPYSALVKDETTLESACRYLGISHYPGKQQYWNKKHHTLFGNTSAKIHTRSKDSASYEKDIHALSDRSGAVLHDIEKDYRKIYYHAIESIDPDLAPQSKSALAMINRIQECLKARDVRHYEDNVDLSETEATCAEAVAYRAKWAMSLAGKKLLPKKVVFRLWPQRPDKK